MKQRISKKYERAAALARKFPDTWVPLTRLANKNSAQSWLWQLQNDMSPSLSPLEFNFKIHYSTDGAWYILINKPLEVTDDLE